MRKDPETFSRTVLLLGSEGFQSLEEAHVLIVGVGGVGGFVAETLVRSGVGRLTLIDADTVQPSNINRQLIATQKSVGRSKVELWSERLLEINPDLHLEVRALFLKDHLTEELLRAHPYDFVVDSIDTLSPKAHLIKALLEMEIPFVSSMGSGAKMDPREIKIGRIDRAINCRLASTLRKRLRKMGVPTDFRVVYSTELARAEATIETDGEQNKKSTSGTIAHMPAAFGCFIAYEVISHLVNKKI